jgi:hypothetical protein
MRLLGSPSPKLQLSTRSGFAALLASASLVACGSSDGTEQSKEGFNPPAAPAGYERIVAPVVTGVKGGADVTYCQYVKAAFDHDVDILDVRGYQSRMGHHSVAYAMPGDHPLNTNEPCTGQENLSGIFIGGIGGEGGGGLVLPEGVAFRLPKGHSLMLNTHFLNVDQEAIDGETVLDVKFAPTDPSRKVITLFSNVQLGFEVAAGASAQATAECELKQDMEFMFFSNHMHDYGTHARSELIRAGSSTPELVHEDPEWSYEMQFDAEQTTWPLDNLLRVRSGDVIKTQCNWNNPTNAPIKFPREMCVGVGFFVSDGSSSPICLNGRWLANRPTPQ